MPSEFTRDEDILGTSGLFKAKLGTHEDPEAVVESIELLIQSGSWVPFTLEGTPCEDCWETSRIYELTVTLPTKTLYANDLVKFVVVPVMVDGQKLYKIWRGDDVLSN